MLGELRDQPKLPAKHIYRRSNIVGERKCGRMFLYMRLFDEYLQFSKQGRESRGGTVR